MSKLNVETGQNVIIQKELANIGERIGAYFIDVLIIGIYSLIVLGLFGLISENASGISGRSSGIFIVLFFIPIFFYSLLSEIFLQGQTLGKKAVKIKVVKLDGGQPTIGSYIIRWLFRLIDIQFMYGIVAMVTIAATGKGQRVGDIVAKTSVISLKRRGKIEDTIFVKLEDEYNLVYPETEILEISDIKIIKDVIANYKKNMTRAIAITMIKDTAEAIKEKTGINSSDTPLLFLETIMKDYTYLNRNKI